EHIENMGPESLIGLDDKGTGRVGLPVDDEGGGGLVYGDPVADECVYETNGRREIRLVGRDDITAGVAKCGVFQYAVIKAGGKYTGAAGGEIRGGGAAAAAQRIGGGCSPAGGCRGIVGCQAVDLADAFGRKCPVVAAAFFDGIAAHAVDVIQQFVPIAPGIVENGIVERDRILDRLAKQPFLRCDRIGRVAVGDKTIGYQGYLRGIGATDNLGQEADDIVEIGSGAQTAVVPGGIGGAIPFRITGFPFHIQAVDHGRADGIEARHGKRIEDVIEGVPIGRTGQDGACGTRLVVVIHYLGQPFDVQLTADVLCFLQIEHVEVPVVVMTGIFL